jgi:hypothetical protein
LLNTISNTHTRSGGVGYELAAFDSARENAEVYDVRVIELGNSRYPDIRVGYADISV